MKKNLIFHPFLLSLFPILAFFNHNFGELVLENLIRPIVFTFAGVFISWFVLDFYLKDKQKSTVVTSLAFFLLLSSGRFLNKTQALGFSDALLPQILTQNHFLPAAVVLLLLLFIPAYLVKKLKNNFQNLTVVLNIASISLLIFPVSAISYKQATRLTHDLGLTRVIKFTLTNRDRATLPDIYYFVIDRYANAGTLKNYYGFDNSDFINFLQSRGFYVASQSVANYPGTHSSLPSSLNMRYLDDLIKKMGPDAYDKTPYYKLIEDNEVVTLLKFKGYKYLHFGSMWDPTKTNKFAGYNYEYSEKPADKIESELKELEAKENPLAVFLMETLGQVVIDELSQEKNYWRISIDQMIELSKSVQIEGPKFVFMHSLIVHPPYVFDANGNPLPQPLEGAGFRREYIEQMKFANKTIEKLIDSILKGSSKPPIIILQSDEGPYPDSFWKGGEGFDWREATTDDIKEKMGILNAYFLPSTKLDSLYPAITPVNSFRVIFNLYFGENLLLLPDKSYIYISRSRPYNLFEVTDLIR